MGHPLWSLYDLRIRTERLELRLPNEEDMARLATQSDGSLYQDPASIPFVIDWPNRPSPERERGFVQFHWKARADWTPEAWNLPLAAFFEGEAVGSQGVQANNFVNLRSVDTGSYLLPKFQGRGLGTEMRAAVLELAFEGLGALDARSSSREDNLASLGVSARLGYVENGRAAAMFGDQRATDIRLLLTREAWQANRIDGISIEGLDPNLEMFGL